MRTQGPAAVLCAVLAACGGGGDGVASVEPPAAACRYAGGLTLDTSLVIADECTIEGNLVVRSAATLEVDYSRNAGARFVVKGDVLVQDDATLWIHAAALAHGVFVVANDFSMHRSITSAGDATVRLEHIDFETQADVDPAKGSIYMTYVARDRSAMDVVAARIVGERAWLLGNFNDASRLRARDTEHLPTEIYVSGASSIRISGDKTRTGVWLDVGGATGALTLPDVSRPYTWLAGRDAGLGVGWALEVDGAQLGLGVEIRPGSAITIHGRGAQAPATGEVKIAYFVVGGAETLHGFKAGLQHAIVSDRLTLDNVQLGPIAWQVYAGDDARLTIGDSTINEIGVFGRNADVKVEDSVLQLAVLAAFGPGSRLEVRDSQLWNQSIEAANGGRVDISNCTVHGGTLFNARDAAAVISISGGAFLQNPAGCTQNTMVDIATGQPKCNPFRPPGLPQSTGPGKVTCTGTAGCTF